MTHFCSWTLTNGAPKLWHRARLVRCGQANGQIRHTALAEVTPTPSAEHLGKRRRLPENGLSPRMTCCRSW